MPRTIYPSANASPNLPQRPLFRISCGGDISQRCPVASPSQLPTWCPPFDRHQVVNVFYEGILLLAIVKGEARCAVFSHTPLAYGRAHLALTKAGRWSYPTMHFEFSRENSAERFKKLSGGFNFHVRTHEKLCASASNPTQPRARRSGKVSLGGV